MQHPIFRQKSYHQPELSTKSRTPIKMKDRPHGVDFEEIDSGKILNPLSHSKYIRVSKDQILTRLKTIQSNDAWNPKEPKGL